MKKWQVLMLTALATGVISAQAANPFSDVTPNDWAYQAVGELAAQGVVEGYPDGTFKGERNITRFEMAQLVARAMNRRAELDANQEAQLQRLEREFASELKSLGVRVTSLEEQVGRVKLGGDFRLSYAQGDSDIRRGHGVSLNRTEARLRLRTTMDVSPKTMVLASLESTLNMHGNAYSDAGLVGFQQAKPETEDLSIKYLLVRHQPMKNVSVSAGRLPVTIGVTGVFYDDTIDGVAVKVGKQEGSMWSAAYGTVQSLNMPFVHPMLAHYGIQAEDDFSDFKPESHYSEYSYNKTRKITAKVWHLQPTSKTGELVKVYGAGLSLWPHPFVNIHGDYILNNAKNDVNGEKPKLWTAGLSFGIAHPKYKKSFQAGLDYVYSDAGSYFGGSRYDVLKPYLSPLYTMKTPQGDYTTAGYAADMIADSAYTIDPVTNKPVREQKYTFKHGGTKLWMASLKYVPVEGMLLEAYYVFNAKSMRGEKFDNNLRVQASYFF
ncbi:MAG: S-layer homology domain-containing protein [Veillonellaceae bacterium]|nr:S-layer homology domain-containing protein [Veillonellaceae bacterium]